MRTRNAWAYYTNDHIAYQARATRYDTNVHTIIYLSATLHLPKPKHTCDSPFHTICLAILLFQAGYLTLLLSTGIPGISNSLLWSSHTATPALPCAPPLVTMARISPCWRCLGSQDYSRVARRAGETRRRRCLSCPMRLRSSRLPT